MPEAPTGSPRLALKDALHRLWARRWLRRLTYTVVAGAVTVGVVTWTVNRPFFHRWLLARLDAAVREETGLGFRAERLDLEPVRGRVVLHQLAYGDDLFQADRLEVHLDLASLLSRRIHIYAVRLDAPRFVLDQARLARLRFKAHPPSDRPAPKVVLDVLQIRRGRGLIQEPAWGLPRAAFTFTGSATGLGPNHVQGDLDLDHLELDLPKGRTSGRIQVAVDASDAELKVKGTRVRLGDTDLFVQGGLRWADQAFTLETRGTTELAQTLRLLTGETRGFAGNVAFKASASGTPRQPQWRLELESKEIRPLSGPFHPGSLSVAAQGTLERATLERIHWDSPDGTVALQGAWSKGRTTRLSLDLRDLDLTPMAGWTKVEGLRDLRGEFDGEVELPGDPWSVPRWDKVKVRALGTLTKYGVPMGELDLTIDNGAVDLQDLNLRLDALQVDGRASARLGRRGLESLQGEGSAITDASRVAEVLNAWHVTDLDMAGWVRATADRVTWNRADGLQLTARAEVIGPRWHGASADGVTASVRIDRDQLFLDDILVRRQAGRALGEIWLTWGEVAPGAPQLDMCFRADRLPVEEGIKAADLDLPLGGTASGWARLRGPYDRILLDGEAVVEQGSAYGITLPAVSGSFGLDLAGNRLKVQDLRVAGHLGDLAPDAPLPQGSLALRGQVDMDLQRGTWFGDLRGAYDSELLGIGGPRVQAQVDGRIQGPWVTPLGPWAVPMGALTFRQGRVFLGEQSLEGLEGRVTTEVGGARLDLGVEGRPQRLLQADLHDAKGALAATVRVDLSEASLDSERLARRSTRDLLHDLTLRAQGSGLFQDGQLAWNGRIDALQARFPGFDLRQRRPSDLKGDLTRAEVALDLQAVPTHPGADPRPSDQADLHFSGTVPFSASGPLDLRIQGLAEVGSVKGMLDLLLDVDENSLLAQLKLQGRTQVELRAGGTPEDPRLDGFVDLRGGSLQLRTYPQSVEDLGFRVLFQGRELLLPAEDPLRGKLAQGDLTASGSATWQLGGLARYDFKAELRDFQLRDLPGLEGLDMNGSLQARFSGTDEEGGLLQGRVVGDRVTYHADLRLADLLLNSSLARSGGLDVDDPLSRIALDLDLDLRQPWLFDTNLLKVEGRPDGTFKVLGNLLNPGLKGKMVLVPGGRVTNLLPAGDIVLERGDLDFTDPYVLNPVVNLQGRVDVPPYLVNLSLTGTLDQLNITPTSTPSLRQDEVVAILIDPSLAPTLGTGASTQGTLNYGIASAAQGLLGSLALSALQEQVRKTFNLDRANVTVRSATGSTETTVTLGKTIPFLGRRVPLIGTYRRAGELITTSGQAEWRIGNWVIQLGASRTTPNETNPTGEVRYTWSPKR